MMADNCQRHGRYSRPFWNKHLTNLSNSSRELPKRFNRTSIPRNQAALKKAREQLEKVIETAACNWIKRKLQDFNGLQDATSITEMKSGKTSKKSSVMKESQRKKNDESTI